MFVANSRHLVLARIKTPKNSYKIPESAVSNMSGFQNFAPDAAFQNLALRDFFTHPTKKMPYHSQILARKPANHVLSKVAKDSGTYHVRVNLWLAPCKLTGWLASLFLFFLNLKVFIKE